MSYLPATATVAAMGNITFTGNVTPETWYQHLRLNGKAYLNAIVILGELVWWYRPKEIRDEQTGQLIGLARKFTGRLLQRSYQALGEKFGLTKKQVADACKFLEQLGIVRLHVEKTVTLPDGKKLGNVLYIDVSPERIREITQPLLPGSNSPVTSRDIALLPGGDNPVTSRDIALLPGSDTNTKIYIYRDNDTEREILSNAARLDDRVLPAAEIQSEPSPPTSTRPDPKKAKRPNRNASAEDIYASLARLDDFNAFFAWYANHCKAVTRRDGTVPSPGKKPAAAIAWRDCIEPLSPEAYQAFREGCRTFDWRQIAIPHAENFLKHRYWEPQPQEAAQEFLAEAPDEWAWLDNPAFVAWLAANHLPNLPGYREARVTIAIAKTWLAAAKRDASRADAARIAWEAFQAHQVQQQVAQAGDIAKHVPLEPSPTERISALNAMVGRGKATEVMALVQQHPEWGICWDGRQVVLLEVAA